MRQKGVPSLRAAVAALPLLVAVALLPTVPDTSAAAAPGPVLGSPAYFAPIGHGWGTARPRVLDNGGDPSGRVVGLRWRHWGEATAKASGRTSLLRPDGGYYGRKGAVALRATALGSCPDGVTAYTRLEVRTAARPGGPVTGPWRPWDGDGDVCTN